MSASSSSSSPWTDLELDLADLLLRRLPSHIDRVRFAAVCRHWRYAAREQSPPALPWISFRTGAIESLSLSRDEKGVPHLFRFTKQQAASVCSGSFGDWQLFKVAGVGPSRRHYMRNLLSGAIVRLPGRCEQPLRANPDGSSHALSLFIPRPSTEFEISKIIVCSNDLIAALIVYVYPGRPAWKQRSVVACCSPGMWSWSRGLYNGDRGHYCYMDMAFNEGKIYAVTSKGHLVAHEVTTSGNKARVCQIKEVIPAPSPANGVFRESCSAMACYLVISHTGKLLMVRWVLPYGDDKRVVLKVFEADLVTSQWVEVKRLDGEVVFVSPNCSKAIRTSTNGGYLKENRIYLTDYRLVMRCWSSLLKDYINNNVAFVYYMRSKYIDPIALGQDITSVQHVDVGWLFP
jgi:hypothetical protein